MIASRGLLMRIRLFITLPFLVLALSLPGCSGKKEEPKPAGAGTDAATPAPDSTAGDQADSLPPPAYESALPEEVRAVLEKPYTGDFDGMVKRRTIRAGVTFNRTHYFVDKGVQRGVAYEYLRLFEEELNKKLKTGNLKIHLIFVPLPREMLLQALLDGKVDLVVAQLTVTPERRKLVDFTNPTRENVDEIVVTGPGSPAIQSVEDLSGQEVFVRRSSSYYQSLLALNQKLQRQGKPPVGIEAAPENLEDDDLLEMTNTGLIGITIVDNYFAEFWKQVFTNLTLHSGVAVRKGGRLAVAIRKNRPKLAAEANAFIARFGLGTAFASIIEKRYLQNTKFVKNATSEAERRKFQALATFFSKYSDQIRARLPPDGSAGAAGIDA